MTDLPSSLAVAYRHAFSRKENGYVVQGQLTHAASDGAKTRSEWRKINLLNLHGKPLKSLWVNPEIARRQALDFTFNNDLQNVRVPPITSYFAAWDKLWFLASEAIAWQALIHIRGAVEDGRAKFPHCSVPNGWSNVEILRTNPVFNQDGTYFTHLATRGVISQANRILSIAQQLAVMVEAHGFQRVIVNSIPFNTTIKSKSR